MPKHTIRVGEETKGIIEDMYQLYDDKVVITTDTEGKLKPTKKAMQYLSVSLTFRVCLIIAAIPHRQSISMPLPPSLPPSLIVVVD